MRTFFQDDPEPKDPSKPYESPFANRMAAFILLQIAVAAVALGFAFLGWIPGTILAAMAIPAVIFVLRKAA